MPGRHVEAVRVYSTGGVDVCDDAPCSIDGDDAKHAREAVVRCVAHEHLAGDERVRRLSRRRLIFAV
jgi:hypothetical protein